MRVEVVLRGRGGGKEMRYDLSSARFSESFWNVSAALAETDGSTCSAVDMHVYACFFGCGMKHMYGYKAGGRVRIVHQDSSLEKVTLGFEFHGTVKGVAPSPSLVIYIIFLETPNSELSPDIHFGVVWSSGMTSRCGLSREITLGTPAPCQPGFDSQHRHLAV